MLYFPANWNLSQLSLFCKQFNIILIINSEKWIKNLMSFWTHQLPPSMSGVHEVFHISMRRKYTPDPAHVVDWEQIEVDTDGTFEEGPVCILDSRDQVLRRKTVRLVRVLWRHYGVEESMWEREDTIRATYPFLFRDEGT